VASTASDAAPSPASVGVRMESQLVFDSCWRRFRERNGMVRARQLQSNDLLLLAAH
jgi:hypothetical protein